VLTDKDPADLIGEHLVFDDELRRSGQFLAAQALQDSESASTVRVRGGRMSVTDGPFMEVKEQFIGFFLIEVRGFLER